MFDSQLMIKGIKLTFGTQTKRINENVETFENLKQKIRELFDFNNENCEGARKFKLYSTYTCNINEDDCESKRKEITNEMEFSKLLMSSQGTCIKIQIEEEDAFQMNQYNTSLLFDNFSFIDYNSNNKCEPTKVENFCLLKKDSQNWNEEEVWLDKSAGKDLPANKREEEITKEFIENILNNILLKKRQSEGISKEYFLNVQNVPTPIKRKYEIDDEVNQINQLNNANISCISSEDQKENGIINQIECFMNSKFSEMENKIENILTKSTHNNQSNNILQKQSSIELEIKSKNIPKEKEEVIIKEDKNNIISKIEFVDKGKENDPPNDTFFNDVCSICSKAIYNVKYSCCICNNMIICPKCENLHTHPLMKFKSKELSTKDEVLSFMASHQEKKSNEDNNSPRINKGFLSKISENLFEKKIKLKMFNYSDSISVRPNKKFKIPIIIWNETKQSIPSTSRIILITRNNKDLKIPSMSVDYDLSSSSRERCEIVLECESNDQIKTYDFEILLYSPKSKIECQPLNMRVEVNTDEEEETINEYFAMYNKILAIPKIQKAMIMQIITEGNCMKHPYMIYNIMIKYDWDVEEALEELTYDSCECSRPVEI